jgi:phospholipase/lecithinase/hemolysin
VHKNGANIPMRYFLTFPPKLFLGAVILSGVLTVQGPAMERAWDALYSFGDSFSDSGAGYADTNGPTAVVYLAQHLQIPFTCAGAPDAAGKCLNFAVSGATTGGGDGRRIKRSLLERGVQRQVHDFVSQVESGGRAFDPKRTLFFIAAGLNDRHIPTTETVANLEGEISALYRSGARYFLLATLPEMIPGFREVGLRLNPAIRRIPVALEQRLPGAVIRVSHWGEYFDDVLRNPSGHGIINTTNPCAGRALFDEDPTPVGPPEQYYYFHGEHPSTAVHRVVGEELYREALALARENRP